LKIKIKAKKAVKKAVKESTTLVVGNLRTCNIE